MFVEPDARMFVQRHDRADRLVDLRSRQPAGFGQRPDSYFVGEELLRLIIPERLFVSRRYHELVVAEERCGSDFAVDRLPADQPLLIEMSWAPQCFL